MGFYDCMGAVSEVLGRRMTMSEFGALYDRLLEEKDGLFKKGYPDDWLAAARSRAAKLEYEKKIALRNVVINKKVHDNAMAFIAGARGKVDTYHALKAFLVGINTPIEGGRDAIGLRQVGLAQQMQGALLADFKRQGDNTQRLEKLFYSRDFETEIAKALNGEPAHEDAVKIAQAVNRVRDDMMRQENEAGGWTAKLEGYITAQSHDSARVRQMGFEAWRDYIKPKLDHAKTFDREEDVKIAMRQERGEILQQQLNAREQLMQIDQNLRAIAKLEKRAERRASRYDDILDGLRQDFAGLVGRFLPIADQPIEERAWLRREIERVRGKMLELQTKVRDAGATIPGLVDDWNASVGLFNKGVEQIELFDNLQQKMLSLEDKIRGAIDPDSYLRRVYNRIVADARIAAPGETKEFSGLMHYVGPQSVAAQRASHRELHFKSATDSVEYMDKLGVRGVADTVMREIESRAHTIELYRKLGTNPQAMWTRIVTNLLKEAQATGDNKLTRQATDHRLGWYLAEVTGETKRVENPTLAMWGSAIRAYNGLTRLGGAMISSFSDIPTAAAELQYMGRGALSSYADMLSGFMHGRRSGERRIILDLLGVGFEGIPGHLMSRYGGEAAPPGVISRAAALMFRLGGLNLWTDAHKATLGLMVSRMYALVRHQGFDELDAPLRTRLAQYGITAKDWDIIRSAAVHAAEDGKEFLTPEGIRQIPLGRLMDLAGEDAEADMAAAERTARNWRDKIAAAYGTMIVDRVDHGVVSPGAETRAIVNMGRPRGDWTGEVLRLAMQFKSFPIAMLYRSLGRMLNGEETTKLSAMARIGWLSFQLAVFGYLAAATKDMLNGKNPRDPLSPDTWVASFAQGGGLGIMGDFAFGEFNRYGRSALSTAAGPTFGLLDDFAHLYAIARDETLEGNWGRNLASSALRFAVVNTPYASLWWLRPALNYMAIYPIQESIAPGYLRRMERRLEHDQKQTFWLPPSEASR